MDPRWIQDGPTMDQIWTMVHLEFQDGPKMYSSLVQDGGPNMGGPRDGPKMEAHMTQHGIKSYCLPVEVEFFVVSWVSWAETWLEDHIRYHTLDEANLRAE